MRSIAVSKDRELAALLRGYRGRYGRELGPVQHAVDPDSGVSPSLTHRGEEGAVAEALVEVAASTPAGPVRDRLVALAGQYGVRIAPVAPAAAAAPAPAAPVVPAPPAAAAPAAPAPAVPAV